MKNHAQGSRPLPESTAGGPSNHPDIILFDADCTLCSGLVAWILRHDRKKRFSFAALTSPFAREAAITHGINTGTTDSLIVLPNASSPLLESDAILHILKNLGGLWRTFALFTLLPKPLRDAAYRTIARNRHALCGKIKTCAIPFTEYPDRFQDRFPNRD